MDSCCAFRDSVAGPFDSVGLGLFDLPASTPFSRRRALSLSKRNPPDTMEYGRGFEIRALALWISGSLALWLFLLKEK
jgi:hypothetical protein